jgi:hypothetical protein
LQRRRKRTAHERRGFASHFPVRAGAGTHKLAQTRAAGFDVDSDHVVADHGVSGVSIRLCERPEGRRLSDLLRRGDSLVGRWVDRLGRNYDDVVEANQWFIKRGIIIKTVINDFTFDDLCPTSTGLVCSSCPSPTSSRNRARLFDALQQIGFTRTQQCVGCQGNP